jgi:hypothetical protein
MLRLLPRRPDDNELGDDLLIGAEAIAKELNWRTTDGRWNRRRVYHLADKRRMPIHRIKGLGVCARRSTLKAFFEQLDQPFIDGGSPME